MAGLTSLGNDFDSVNGAMNEGRSGIRHMEDWARYEGLNTQLAAPIADFALPEHYPRKKIRSMGRVASMAVVATERALQNAHLIDAEMLSNGDCGIAYGSSSGSPDALADFVAMLNENSTRAITSTSYIRMMSHTAAVNTSLFFSIRGRLISTSTACTSGSQAIGYAYEAVKHGAQRAMVAGGAEELSATQAAVFDTLFATSCKNDAPSTTPRPFDRDRDGLVIGEGAATSDPRGLRFGSSARREHLRRDRRLRHQLRRRARHATDVGDNGAARCAARCDDSGLDAAAIGYVNGHGTATELGDIAESHATSAVFGERIPISCIKGYFGHTLGACGAHRSVARDRDDESRRLSRRRSTWTTSIRAARARLHRARSLARSTPNTS